ncbi:MAG: cache domain-containing protein, partial [Anaerolineales bacterium]
MANKHTPKDDDEKIVKDNIQKRFRNMFSGQGQPLSNMSIQEVEAMQAQIAKLEAELAEQRAAPAGSRPAVSSAGPAVHFSSNSPSVKSAAEQQETVDSNSLGRSIGLWVTAISAAVGLAFFGVDIYLVFGTQGGIWELSDKVLTPFTLLMFLTGLIGWNLVRRNHILPGVWAPYLVSVILGPVVTVMVVRDFHFLMGGYLVMFALLFIVLVLPKTSRLWASLAAAGTALAIVGIEIWDPAFRLETSQIENLTLMILGPAALGILALFIATHQLRNPRIQTRLTTLLMTVMIPLLVTLGIIMVTLSRTRIESGANTELQGTSRSLASTVSLWLESNIKALDGLTRQPDIISMDAEQQRPVLQAMAKVYPYMYLVSTTDLRGMNIARNDNADLADYSDREWFQGSHDGAPITYQTLIGRTSGQPALAISMPIKSASGRILGVGMFAANLTDLAEETQVSKLGERGFTYIVDASNQALAHPDTTYTAELRDMSEYPPVVALRQGQTGMITFTDENGERWRAYGTTLDNGWAIIAQRPESEILAPARQVQTLVTILVLVGGALMLALAWFTIRSTLQPIATLTETISAISAGDLNRVVEVKSRDEIGTLAHTFNTMTGQIRNLVGSLEQRVADRTHDLELASEVGRTATEKLTNLSKMLTDAAEMIRTRFDLYYTQIYLTDPSGERLVLKAGTGEVGKQLLERGHYLIINSNSLNGRAILDKQAQIVHDTKENPSFLPNPLLPNTRSEMCIPLIVGGNVVGVLDMQSERPGALSEGNRPAFQALAEQLAIAVQNAALFAQLQEARAEAETQIHRFTEQGWQEFLDAVHQAHRIGFAFDESQVIRLKPDALSADSDDGVRLPLNVTGTRIGEIYLPNSALSASELELAQTTGAQLAQHVENLRLLAQAQQYREEAEQAVRRLTHEGWDSFLQTHTGLASGYMFDLNEVKPLSEKNGNASDYAVKHTMAVGQEVIGELAVDIPERSDEAVEVIESVAQQLSGHIENLRLSELNEKHAQREQTLRQITSTLRGSNNPATILRTAVRELGSIMGRRAVVQLISPQQAESAGDNKNESD